MGRDAFEASPEARAVFAAADAALGFPLSRLCFEGPEAELVRTEIQQPAILTVSVALLRALQARGPRPRLRRRPQPGRVHRPGGDGRARFRGRAPPRARARPLHAGGGAGRARRDGGGDGLPARRGRGPARRGRQSGRAVSPAN
jgi:hypothetical protein